MQKEMLIVKPVRKTSKNLEEKDKKIVNTTSLFAEYLRLVCNLLCTEEIMQAGVFFTSVLSALFNFNATCNFTSLFEFT
jgi:hypothetical protein